MSKALDKKKLVAELERERRAKVNRRLRELRSLIALARKARKEAIGLVRDQCKAARAKLRANCARRVTLAKTDGVARVQASKRTFERERSDERLLREADRRSLGSGVRALKRGVRLAERRQESDDEVRNLLR